MRNRESGKGWNEESKNGEGIRSCHKSDLS